MANTSTHTHTHKGALARYAAHPLRSEEEESTLHMESVTKVVRSHCNGKRSGPSQGPSMSIRTGVRVLWP